MEVRNPDFVTIAPTPPPHPYEGQKWYDGCTIRAFLLNQWHTVCFDDIVLEELNAMKY